MGLCIGEAQLLLQRHTRPHNITERVALGARKKAPTFWQNMLSFSSSHTHRVDSPSDIVARRSTLQWYSHGVVQLDLWGSAWVASRTGDLGVGLRSFLLFLFLPRLFVFFALREPIENVYQWATMGDANIKSRIFLLSTLAWRDVGCEVRCCEGVRGRGRYVCGACL